MPETDLPPLPLDIPWKRLCISRDMLDAEVCDHDFPLRWKSSVAVFGYEPPADEQPFDDLTVSYLKVSCTITGHNPGDEIGAGTDELFSYDPITQKARLPLSDYRGCYGAILEVSIGPNTPEADPGRLPYVLDFQPKKRELYELVTQTGTKLSRSLEGVQVTKSGTTASSSEIVDNDTGIDWSSVGGIGGGLAGGALTGGSPIGVAVGGTVGSALGGLFEGDDAPKPINQAQQTNVLTTDRSTEKREEFSYTTQLAQMYHQLTGYHLGTNRALFFLLPRPHIVQTDPTFVNGPRVLEGMQEFLLVVARSRSVSGLCVDAYLETAHLYYDTAPARFETFAEGWEIDKVLYTPSLSLKATYTPPDGWEFDTDNPQAPGGYQVNYVTPSSSPLASSVEVKITENNKAVVTLTVYGEKKTLGGSAYGLSVYYVYDPNLVAFEVEFALRKVDADPKDIPKRLYILGRGECCCQPLDLTTEPPEHEVALVYEKPLVSDASIPPLGSPDMSMVQANQLTTAIGQQFIRSVNDPERYARGTVSFVEAQFIADAAAQRIASPDHPENQLVQDIAGLDDEVRRHLTAVNPRLRRAELLRMRVAELRDRFDLTAEQATHLRRAALWLEEPLPNPAVRWDPPDTWAERAVPDLTGLDLGDAVRAVAAARMRVGEVDYTDSEQPSGTVLEQIPGPGERVRGWAVVDLTVSTGLSVQIPDVRDQRLSEALCTLRHAGLEREPLLRFEPDPQREETTVLDVEPPVRTYVTPHAPVTLRVAQPTDQ